MKKLFLLLPVMLNLFQHPSFSQQSKADSLLLLLKKDKEDTNKVNHLNQLCRELYNKSPDSAIYFGGVGLGLAQKINFKKGEANAYSNMGVVYFVQSNYDSAKKYTLKALEIRNYIGDKNGIAASLNNLGMVSKERGNYNDAIDYYIQALKINEELGNKNFQARNLKNIGMIYRNQNNTDKAMEYYMQSLKISEEIGDKFQIASTLHSIGIAYNEKGNYDKALEYYFKSLKIKKEISDMGGMAATYSTIGGIYRSKKNYDKSIQYFLKSLKINQDLKMYKFLAGDYSNIGSIYMLRGNYKLAIQQMNLGLKLAKQIEAREDIIDAYSNLSDVYAKLSNYKRAFEYHHLYSEVKDSLLNEKNNKQIAQLSAQYESEKKDNEIKLLNKDREAQAKITAETNRRKNIILWSVVCGLLLVIVFAGLIFRSLRVTRKQKQIIEVQKSEVEKAKHIIQEKNKDIVDSINYAKRLQDAILPPDNFWKQHLPESFVLYKAKDIVSGDFYFMESVNGNVIFSAADATGHGVPACILTVVCSNALNRAIKEFHLTEPNKILSKVCELELETFGRSETAVRDGMDIALCSYSKHNNQLLYSGAHRPLWIIRNGKNAIEEIKATKTAIGISAEVQQFEQHSLSLNSGDTLYIFSDGYVDQFSPDDKKLMTRKFKELLLSIQDKTMNEQKEFLDSYIKNWRENTEQTDDILVIGVKIS